MRLEDSWNDRKVGRCRWGSRQAGGFFFSDGVFSIRVNPGCGARGQCQGAIGPCCPLAGGPWGSSQTLCASAAPHAEEDEGRK